VAAQDVVQQQKNAARQALPSIFTVQVLGFGNDPASDDTAPPPQQRRKSANEARYDPAGAIRFLGHGALTPEQIASLTEDERRGLPQGR
jgi:hypothetical protein